MLTNEHRYSVLDTNLHVGANGVLSTLGDKPLFFLKDEQGRLGVLSRPLSLVLGYAQKDSLHRVFKSGTHPEFLEDVHYREVDPKTLCALLQDVPWMRNFYVKMPQPEMLLYVDSFKLLATFPRLPRLSVLQTILECAVPQRIPIKSTSEPVPIIKEVPVAPSIKVASLEPPANTEQLSNRFSDICLDRERQGSTNPGRLASLREKGLDVNGIPKSSYWNACIQAEENKSRLSPSTFILWMGVPNEDRPYLLSLAREQAAREQAKKSTSPLEAITKLGDVYHILALPSAPDVLALIVGDNFNQKSTSQTSSQPTTRTQASSTQAPSKDVVSELKSQLLASEQARLQLQTQLQAKGLEQQEIKRDLVKQLQDALDIADVHRNKVQSLEALIAAMKEEKPLKSSEHAPTLRDFLTWLGIPISAGRTLAMGHDGSYDIIIRTTEDKIVRMAQMEHKQLRATKSVSLDGPISELPGLFLPYRCYYSYQTDAQLIEAVRILGRVISVT